MLGNFNKLKSMEEPNEFRELAEAIRIAKEEIKTAVVLSLEELKSLIKKSNEEKENK